MSAPVRQVAITEVLLRDGFQIEPTPIPTADKVQLGRGLLDAGLTALEAGAFVDPGRVPQMADTAGVVGRLRALAPASRLYTLIFNERGARQAVTAGVRHARLVVSASDGHSRANAGADTAGALRRLEPAAAVLKAAGVTLEASIATACSTARPIRTVRPGSPRPWPLSAPARCTWPTPSVRPARGTSNAPWPPSAASCRG
jgi:hydroxymethylglutaryl-CoA lyase